MIIYNLTDRTPPWEKKPRTPNKIKIRGVQILPGDQHEFSDFPLAQVSGHINAHRVSVDGIPDWYQKAEASEKEERFKVHFAQVAEKAAAEKSVKASVGAMDVEVTAGDDGELGTDDDEVKITPKRKKSKKGKKK